MSLIISADEHFLFAAVVDVGQGRGHTPFGDHAARHGSRLFDILRSARSNILYYQRFCGSAAHRHCDSVLQMRQSHVRIVGFRTGNRISRRHSARNDRNFLYGVAVFQQTSHQSVAGFVIRGDAFILFGNYAAALLRTGNDLVDAFQDIVHLNDLSAGPCRYDSRFVQQIFDIRAAESCGQARKVFKIDLGREGFVPGVDFEYGFAALDVGQVDENLSVESAGTQQCGIQYVGTVRSRHNDYGFVLFETVHLHQQLVQGLFSFVVAAAQACASLSANGVDFVDKDDTGLSLFGLVKQISDAAGAYAYEHFDKVRTGYGIKGYARFAGNSLCKQSFTRSGRADQQNAFRHSGANVAELFGGFQEFDDLLQFHLFFFGSGYVGKTHFDVFGNFGLRLSEVQRAARAALFPDGNYHINCKSAQDQQHQDREDITAEIIVLRSVQPNSRQSRRRRVFRFFIVLFDRLYKVVAVDGYTGGACKPALFEVRNISFVRFAFI